MLSFNGGRFGVITARIVVEHHHNRPRSFHFVYFYRIKRKYDYNSFNGRHTKQIEIFVAKYDIPNTGRERTCSSLPPQFVQCPRPVFSTGRIGDKQSESQSLQSRCRSLISSCLIYKAVSSFRSMRQGFLFVTRICCRSPPQISQAIVFVICGQFYRRSPFRKKYRRA